MPIAWDEPNWPLVASVLFTDCCGLRASDLDTQVLMMGFVKVSTFTIGERLFKRGLSKSPVVRPAFVGTVETTAAKAFMH